MPSLFEHLYMTSDQLNCRPSLERADDIRQGIMPRMGYPSVFLNISRWPVRCMQDLQRSLQDQTEVCQR